MPTPRPFNTQTGFTETPLGEINRQVQRMKQLGAPQATKATAGPLASAKGLAGKLLKGTNAYFIAEALKPYTTDPLGKYLGNNLTQGILTVAGATAEQKAMAAGLPVVKSVGKTDFNISTAEGKKAYKKALNATKSDDPKRTPGGGLNTGTGKVTTYDSFQEQQAALMGSLGVTTSPFSSTRLPATPDSIYNQFATGDDVPDFGIDPSKILANVDTEKLGELYNNSDKAPSFRITEDEPYSSPVNFSTGPSAVEPMLNPEVDSMTAMRMKDRDLGLMYASGQFFAEGKDGKSVLVNRDLAKDVRRGKEGAADQLAAYLAGGGIKPQGGVIANPPREQMVPTKQEEATSLVDPSFSKGDYEFMGGDPANSAIMQEGGAIQMDIDSNFDLDNPNTTRIGANQHPFTKLLAENPVNEAAKPQVVDTERFGSVTSLINKYGIDDYLARMDAGQFF